MKRHKFYTLPDICTDIISTMLYTIYLLGNEELFHLYLHDKIVSRFSSHAVIMRIAYPVDMLHMMKLLRVMNVETVVMQ